MPKQNGNSTRKWQDVEPGLRTFPAGLTALSKLMRGTATWEVCLLEDTPSSLLVYLPFSHSQCPVRPDSLGCFWEGGPRQAITLQQQTAYAWSCQMAISCLSDSLHQGWDQAFPRVQEDHGSTPFPLPWKEWRQRSAKEKCFCSSLATVRSSNPFS